ncbi:MAG: hypothetical protein D6824_00570 [Planctomycetota bacterium]|nr:MAG: hypothetical protein D6824_00570 [Planctomycetota bacterium]
MGGASDMEQRLQALVDRVQTLERRRRRLERTVGAVAVTGLVAFVALATLTRGAGVAQGAQPAQEQAGQPRNAVFDEIVARRIVVVDDAGVERVKIAAPLPDPILLGKRIPRGGSVSGVLLFDAEGNERGGYITSDEARDVALTMDEVGRASLHLGVGARGESHLTFSDGRGRFAAFGLTPKNTYLFLGNGDRKTMIEPQPSQDSDQGDDNQKGGQ